MITQVVLSNGTDERVYWLYEDVHGGEYQRLRPSKKVSLAELDGTWTIIQVCTSLKDERSVPKIAKFGTLLEIFDGNLVLNS